MKYFESKGLNEPMRKFTENIFLGILEYILEEGVDNALDHLSDATEEDVRTFPHVRKALKERGILK